VRGKKCAVIQGYTVKNLQENEKQKGNGYVRDGKTAYIRKDGQIKSEKVLYCSPYSQ
jgi:cell wall assembly regulator SMI1